MKHLDIFIWLRNNLTSDMKHAVMPDSSNLIDVVDIAILELSKWSILTVSNLSKTDKFEHDIKEYTGLNIDGFIEVSVLRKTEKQLTFYHKHWRLVKHKVFDLWRLEVLSPNQEHMPDIKA